MSVFYSAFSDELRLPSPTLFLLAVFLECEVQENSLAPGFKGASDRLDVVLLPCSCPGSGHVGAGMHVYAGMHSIAAFAGQ